MELQDFEYNFIDKIYEYAGLWGRKSKCGLKIIDKPESNIVIVTDLYEENPGGSITEFCAELAMLICKEFNIESRKLIFIHHVPEVKSSLEFYSEAFYKVHFKIINEELQNPDWHSIERNEVEKVIQS